MSLLLHCGASSVNRAALAAVPTPPPMGPRHKPVPYSDFADLTVDALDHVGLRVIDEEYGLLKDGSRMFGLLEVAPKLEGLDRDFGLMVGLRASHDQSFARGLVVGSRVFVCDNLAFSGEVSITTKQTLNIESRLPGMVYEAVETIPGTFAVQDQRFESYRETELKSRWGDAALVELVRRDVLSGSALGKALVEWDNPTYEAHAEAGYSVWRLMQAVTEALKAPRDPETGNPTRPAAPMAMEKTVRMTRFLDEICGFDAGNMTAKQVLNAA
jgi:hypothetical protein